MLSKIKKKLFNYLFIRFEIFQKEKIQKEKELLLTKFKKIGNNINFGKDNTIENPHFIEIGNNFYAMERFTIEAWQYYNNQVFKPSIKIGNNVRFNTDIHIGAIKSITIGDDCLFASRIYITDHNHGDTTDGMISLTPIERPLICKGSVVIENNVWVGEGVVIMPNVTIGKNSIIAANSVVTKSIPENSVAAGVPARVIKNLV